MFLMNAPPVVALQSKWEAFSPPGSFRFPGCFSESTEGVGRASVSAEVQMIISTLQSDQAALGMSHERTLQRSQRAERGREARLATSPAVQKEQPTFAACGLRADLDAAEEGATDFGPSVLDSDSDDSVDRDIEEAIQEYLKAKSGCTQPPGVAERDSRCKPEPPQPSSPTALCSTKLASGSGGVSGSPVGTSLDQGSASPVSMSSEDSFEQSIRAEIEQFLSEKRQHKTPTCDLSANPNENLARSAFQPSKEPVIKVPQQDLLGTCKEFVFQKTPRLAKVTTQPRSLKSKASTEPNSLSSTKLATTCPPSEAPQSKGGVRRSTLPGRRGKRVTSAALVQEVSDSSSDDGIEEAIQLYQLEKRREMGGDPLGEEKGPSPAAHSTSHTTKSALPETCRKTPNRKKPLASKTSNLSPSGLDLSHLPKPPKETGAPASAVNTATKSDLANQSSCRVDTSTELMCAEAILDISKTILPTPVEGSDGPCPASPVFYPLSVPSHSDGDSSSVDSDDSIEQEIRMFLALKAQAGSLLGGTEPCPPSTQSSLLSPGPHSQASGPRAPLPKPLDLPLGCKRKCRGSSSVAGSSIPKKMRELAKDSAQDADTPSREGESRGLSLPSRTAELREEHGTPDGRLAMSPGPGNLAEAPSMEDKESSDDKSSSLDSDEDLDTAIKDLLRSKQKLKKRWRDPRAMCKKKVRFSTTTQFIDKLGGFQKAWKDKSPHLLKSCLSKPKRDSREHLAQKPIRVFSRADSTGGQEVSVTPQLRSTTEGGLFLGDQQQHPATSPSSLSDDSSSVDSDDSIELEIRKFLAEKAKESVSGSEVQGRDTPTLGAGSGSRPEVLCRKGPTSSPSLPHNMCTRSQKGREACQLTEMTRGTGRAGAPRPGGIFLQGARSCCPASPARCELAVPRSSSGTVSTKASPATRRNSHAHKDQSPRGAELAPRDSAFGQLPGSAKSGTAVESPSHPFPGNSQSRSLLTWNPAAESEAGPHTGLSLPWADFASQSRLQGTWALSSEGRDLAWARGLGGEKEKAAESQSRCSPSLVLDPKKGLPFSGFSPLLPTQVFHFGKSVSWGAKPASLFSPPLSLPLQGPSFSTFREAPASCGPVFGTSHLLMKKEDVHWLQRRSQAGLGMQTKRNTGSEEGIVDLRYRPRTMERDEEDQEALGSDASEFSDTSVEEGDSSSMAKGKVLKL
ncbi:protein phosphatase 1 regulatory subunit 26 [Erinaceus europaeus]|uniref:Protein phosphatase 1 regulatory subunit 26 n=1 Tax=Erinaceus europaeus TaxID=9365 RepID=A0ABM3Y2K8_ERIEU|nr:protein phosphatase 1 regulatory subunit 26 [Erinaceus europaeus]XP_060055308.1 protein phosphatase 1 regulatory subunit 26 [Erinaceus europaeus]XP_060055309.1 protein phosphatase 1 regulatory subunit 26 [Erinaceus europaeus]XP_060055310.1 protein phosphatase 1 regulatory subunit 26 [Erinaceus europaeus]XP_060055311.1 protein phosphatase 1 regulatory subunit 26 [Erinaceus europaeus]XP_060055312.1 protein phosphatase 1 regulatory subunit 26 [Erinaceus europaeus]XP_060055313.1 protein phosph